MDPLLICKRTQELKTQTTISLEIPLILRLECNGGQIKRNMKIEFFLSKHLIQLHFLFNLLIRAEQPQALLLLKVMFKQDKTDPQALQKSPSEAQVRVKLQPLLLPISALEIMMKFHLTRVSNSTLLIRLVHSKEPLDNLFHLLMENKCL